MSKQNICYTHLQKLVLRAIRDASDSCSWRVVDLREGWCPLPGVYNGLIDCPDHKDKQYCLADL